MTFDTQKLRELVADVNAASEAHGETDWYTQGIIYIDPDGLGEADSHLIAHLSPERVTAIADHIDAQAAQLAAYPADWRKDSSLETWFPYSAKQLKVQTAEIERLRHEIDGFDGTIAKRDYEIEQLRAALEVSREFIATTREELVVTHGINGVIPADEVLGLAGVADCDAILKQIDSALSGEGK